MFSAKLSNRFNGSISLNYGVNQYAETFAEAYRNGNTRQSVIVGFQIPVFQWGVNKNRIKIAENNYEVNKIARERQMREFENEVKENINSYNHSVKLWLTAQKVYNLSHEQYKMLIQKFSLGKVSVYELTTTQNEQNNALQRYYSAIRNTYNSYFTLRSMALMILN
ncbi:MAG: TolC family protein [Dysgonamonadaceae bacterium]|nr:TolC family protein [Dysgonamonadaceae bacterium]